MTDEGQKQFATDLLNVLAKHESVTGLFWWEMEYNAYGTSLKNWYNASFFDNTTGKITSAFSVIASFADNSGDDDNDKDDTTYPDYYLTYNSGGGWSYPGDKFTNNGDGTYSLTNVHIYSSGDTPGWFRINASDSELWSDAIEFGPETNNEDPTSSEYSSVISTSRNSWQVDAGYYDLTFDANAMTLKVRVTGFDDNEGEDEPDASTELYLYIYEEQDNEWVETKFQLSTIDYIHYSIANLDYNFTAWGQAFKIANDSWTKIYSLDSQQSTVWNLSPGDNNVIYSETAVGTVDMKFDIARSNVSFLLNTATNVLTVYQDTDPIKIQAPHITVPNLDESHIQEGGLDSDGIIKVYHNNKNEEAVLSVIVPESNYEVYYKILNHKTLSKIKARVTTLEGYVKAENGKITLSDGTGTLALYVTDGTLNYIPVAYDYNVAYNSSTGIDNVHYSDSDSLVKYFNLQGLQVENPRSGIYIKVTGSKIEKVIVD